MAQFDINSNILILGTSTSDAFIKSGGTSLQFLKADGSVDTTLYLHQSNLLQAILNIDGPGSGINADLLDGQEGDYYNHRIHGLGTTSTIGGPGRNDINGFAATSFNDFYQTGFHTADAGTNYTDGPYSAGGASKGAIINFNSHTSGVTQFFSKRENNELWYRDSYGGWKPWVQILDTGMLGSVPLSAFSNDLNFDANYVKKTGDVMSGALTITASTLEIGSTNNAGHIRFARGLDGSYTSELGYAGGTDYSNFGAHVNGGGARFGIWDDGVLLAEFNDNTTNKLLVYGDIRATKLKIDGGTADQILLGDGTTTSLTALGDIDTLQSVTDRGNTTTNSITAGGLISKSMYSKANGTIRVSHLEGGQWYMNSSGGIGAIKITLPPTTLNSNTIFKFWGDFRAYNPEYGNFSILFDCFNPTNGSLSGQPVIIGSSDTSDVTIRYGSDGINHCIWIGDVDTNWQHINLNLRDLIASNGNADERWATGWNISIVTTFDTIHNTYTDNFVYSDFNKLKNIPANLAIGDFLPRDGSLPMTGTLLETRPNNGTDFNAFQIANTGSWSLNSTSRALINVTDNNDPTKTVGKFGIGFNGNGRFVVTNLYNNGYGASGEVFIVDGLGNAIVSNNITANAFIKSGGTAAQFLKADGSIDSNTYLTSIIGDAKYLQLNASTTINPWSGAIDLDTVTTGMFFASTDSLKRPNNLNSHILSQSYAGSYVQQTGGRNGRFYIRHKENGVWTLWNEAYTTANLNNVSQLTNDAGYLTSTTGDSAYLKLTGGTLTGTLNINAPKLVGTSALLPVIENFVALPKGNSAGPGLDFRFDASETAWAPDMFGSTVVMLEGVDPGSTELNKLWGYNKSIINLNTYKSAGGNFEIELQNLSITNNSNNQWKPYVLFHAAASNAGNMVISLLEGDGITWREYYNGPAMDAYVPKDNMVFATGILKGVRLRFEGITGNSYLKMVGVTSTTAHSFQWQMLKSGGAFMGDISGKVNGQETWSISQDGVFNGQFQFAGGLGGSNSDEASAVVFRDIGTTNKDYIYMSDISVDPASFYFVGDSVLPSDGSVPVANAHVFAGGFHIPGKTSTDVVMADGSTSTIAALSDAAYVNVTGDTMTGALKNVPFALASGVDFNSINKDVFSWGNTGSALNGGPVLYANIWTLPASNKALQISIDSDYNESGLFFRQWNNNGASPNGAGWQQWSKVWTDINLTNVSQLANDAGYLTSTTGDSAYVKKAGDTMSGKLTIAALVDSRLQIQRTGGHALDIYAWDSGINIFGSATVPSIYFGRDATNDNDWYFYSNSYGSYATFQGDTGRVGIGTITPAYKLDVNGNARLQGMVFDMSGATRSISTHSNAGRLQLNGGTNAAGGARIEIEGTSYNTSLANIHLYSNVTYINSQVALNGLTTITKTDTPGETVFDVQGSAGQLFSISDSLEGDLFSVNDISGLPILNVNSDDLVEIYGVLNINSGKFTGITVDTTIKTINISGYDSAHFDYVVTRTDIASKRTGTIMVTWDGTNTEWNEISTADLGGATTGISFTVDILNGEARLRAIITSGTWSVKAGARVL